jgi:hypothetical protein
MIATAKLRAARSLAGVSRQRPARFSRLSPPAIPRVEASETMASGRMNFAVKPGSAPHAAGAVLIGDGIAGQGSRRGVRLKTKRTAKAESNAAPAPDRFECPQQERQPQWL